jgi:hypothetical protein
MPLPPKGYRLINTRVEPESQREQTLLRYAKKNGISLNDAGTVIMGMALDAMEGDYGPLASLCLTMIERMTVVASPGKNTSPAQVTEEQSEEEKEKEKARGKKIQDQFSSRRQRIQQQEKDNSSQEQGE